jgi:putative membrane protein
MSKENNLERVIKGAVAGALAGIVASWAANQFHSLWSHLAGEEQDPEVARLSDRGGRPDTAAAKEKVASGGPPQEDATVAIASKVSRAVFDRPLTKKEKHQAGVGVHYVFGAASGALYGALAELTSLTVFIQRIFPVNLLPTTTLGASVVVCWGLTAQRR